MKDEAFNQQDKRLRKYLKPDLVIIDDMGLKQLPKHSGEYLLEVIMRRYENTSTIITSNRPLEQWGKLLCDVPTAGAIIDRFLGAIALARKNVSPASSHIALTIRAFVATDGRPSDGIFHPGIAIHTPHSAIGPCLPAL